jgi:uncharacterized protein (TIGR02246 family)
MGNDVEQIRQTLALYSQRHDDRDAAGYVALFAEQGAFVLPNGVEHRGRAALEQFIKGLYANQPPDRRSKHYFGNSVVEVHDDVAEAATDCVVYESFGDDIWQLAQINRHYDRLVRDNATWLFLEKRVEPR